MGIDLNDAEVKAAIKAAVDEAVAEETRSLKAQNYELVGQLRQLKKGQQVNPDEHARIERELEEVQSKLTESKKALKSAQGESEKYKKAYETETQVAHRLLVENGLTDALTKAGVVNPVHLKAAKAMLAGQVQLVAEGENRIAKVGDKALGDYVGEWAKGDEGKHFVAAQQNGGGGATGGAGKGGNAKTMTRTAFDGLDAVAKSKFIADGGSVTDAAA